MAREGGDREADGGGLWFRDRLHDVLGLGAAAFVVIGGWLLSSDSIIGLDHAQDADHREAAQLLLVAMPLLWAGWYAYLVRLRSRCPEHPTVPRRAMVHALAWVAAIGLAALLRLVAFD